MEVGVSQKKESDFGGGGRGEMGGSGGRGGSAVEETEVVEFVREGDRRERVGTESWG